MTRTTLWSPTTTMTEDTDMRYLKEIEDYAALCSMSVDDYLSECHRRTRHLVNLPEECEQCGKVVSGWGKLHRSDIRRGGLCDACHTEEVVAIWGEEP